MIANWVIGVLLATLASVISNLGLNLQKLNHTLNEQRIRSQAREERRRLEAENRAKGNNNSLYGTNAQFGTTGNKILNESLEATSSYQNDTSPNEMTRSQKMINNIFPNTDMSPQASTATSTTTPHITTTNVLPPNSSFPSVIPPNQQQQSQQQILVQAHADAYHKLNKIPYTKQSMWRAGMSLVTLGSLLDFTALIFAAQSIVAPLGSLTLVSNTFFAPILLGETVSQRDLMATLAIVVGSATAVIFADHEDNIFSSEEIFSFFGTTRFVLYSIVIIVSLVSLFYWKRYLSYLRLNAPRRYSESCYAQYHRFTYASLAGIMGAQSVLFAKCTGEILVNSFADADQFMFAYWQTYLVLLGMFFSIYFQIKFLNSGLKHFEALFIVPVFQSFWILVSVVAGMIFFGEYKRVFNEPGSSVGFPCGVIVTIAGVYVLSQRGGGERNGQAKATPQQRDYKHYRSTLNVNAPSIFNQAESDLTTETTALNPSSGQFPSLDAWEEEPLYTASPAPPLGFMNGPFLDTRYSATGGGVVRSTSFDSSLIDTADLEPPSSSPNGRSSRGGGYGSSHDIEAPNSRPSSTRPIQVSGATGRPPKPPTNLAPPPLLGASEVTGLLAPPSSSAPARFLDSSTPPTLPAHDTIDERDIVDDRPIMDERSTTSSSLAQQHPPSTKTASKKSKKSSRK